jgi:hypothetical protein
MVLCVIRTRGKHFQRNEAKCSPFFTEKRQAKEVGSLELGVHRSPFTVRRSLFAVHCSPFTVRRAEWSHATLTVNLTPPQKSRIANFESRICAELAVSNPFFKFNPQFAIRNCWFSAPLW